MALLDELRTLLEDRAATLGVPKEELASLAAELSDLYYRWFAAELSAAAEAKLPMYAEDENLQRIARKLTPGDAAFLVAAKEWCMRVPAAKKKKDA